MGDLQPYEIAILLKMYDEGIIANAYKPIERVHSKIKWRQIASAYRVKDSFESVARRLVKMKLLTDHGKSMAVLALDKLGVDYVVGYLKIHPNAMKELESMLS